VNYGYIVFLAFWWVVVVNYLNHGSIIYWALIKCKHLFSLSVSSLHCHSVWIFLCLLSLSHIFGILDNEIGNLQSNNQNRL